MHDYVECNLDARLLKESVNIKDSATRCGWRYACYYEDALGLTRRSGTERGILVVSIFCYPA